MCGEVCWSGASRGLGTRHGPPVIPSPRTNACSPGRDDCVRFERGRKFTDTARVSSPWRTGLEHNDGTQPGRKEGRRRPGASTTAKSLRTRSNSHAVSGSSSSPSLRCALPRCSCGSPRRTAPRRTDIPRLAFATTDRASRGSARCAPKSRSISEGGGQPVPTGRAASRCRRLRCELRARNRCAHLPATARARSETGSTRLPPG